MGKILIVASTLLIIFSLLGLRHKNNKRLIKNIKTILKQINNTYKEIFTEKDLVSRMVHGLIFVISELLVIFTVVRVGIYKLIENFNLTNIISTLILISIVLMAIHIALGYLLMITSGIQKFISKVEDKSLKYNLLISYFIISTYFTVYLVEPKEFIGIEYIALVGLAVSYILNLKVLIKLIINPARIKSNNTTEDKRQQIGYRIAIVSVLILFMIILNLFLAVGIIDQSYPSAFTNNPTRFDLFYYTIITFTTIGYGDIVPVGIPAKIISMIIAITSVICLTIFLSTVMSYREENDE
ncbi:MAG: potassium channel family protein [Peptostreptococcaceae bacterium]